jgi:hypothetical protein
MSWMMLAPDKPGVGIAHTFYAVAGNLGQALRIRGGFDTAMKARSLGNVELDCVMLGVGIGVLGLPALFAGRSALVNLDRVPLTKLNSA